MERILIASAEEQLSSTQRECGDAQRQLFFFRGVGGEEYKGRNECRSVGRWEDERR